GVGYGGRSSGSARRSVRNRIRSERRGRTSMDTAAKGSGALRSAGSQYVFLYAALAALAIFVAGAWAAWRYAPLADPYEPAAERSLSQRLVSPVERNAFMRLPFVRRPLNDVFALRGTGHVWVAGDDGLILHS